MQTTVGADFDPEAFDHVAVYHQVARRIEMRLRARYPHIVHFPALNLAIALQQGEELLTEISTKYDRERIEAMLAKAGFDLQHWYTDSEELIGLALAQKLP